MVGLFMPWYYESTAADGKHEMNALGGTLVSFLEKKGELQLNPLYFNSLTAYLSIIFALFSILFPLASMKLAEKSQRKWIAIVSLLGGIVAIANIFYIHSWLGWYYPDGLLFSSDENGSRGPLLGYFMAWAAAVMLFASTYVSRGLAQVLPAKSEKSETKADESVPKE